jgi:hypothetical protein
MPTMEVFDPAMCCSTGVCGPSVDPALARFAADLEWLRGRGVEVKRFNLAREPAAFVNNSTVADALRGRDDALPLLLVDGAIVSQGKYPDRATLAILTGLVTPVKSESASPQPSCCSPSQEPPIPLGGRASAPKKCC